MADIDVIGPIEMGFADQLRKTLRTIPAHEPIELYIGSPGGLLCEGITAYNLLRQAKNEKIAYMIGDAFSAATLLVCAADHCDMAANALFMVHEPYVPLLSPATLESVATVTRYLKATKGQAVDIYAAKTGKSKTYVSGLMRQQTYMTAEEALSAGFVSNVVAPSPHVRNESPETYTAPDKDKLAAMLGQRRLVRDVDSILKNIGVAI